MNKPKNLCLVNNLIIYHSCTLCGARNDQGGSQGLHGFCKAAPDEFINKVLITCGPCRSESKEYRLRKKRVSGIPALLSLPSTSSLGKVDTGAALWGKGSIVMHLATSHFPSYRFPRLPLSSRSQTGQVTKVSSGHWTQQSQRALTFLVEANVSTTRCTAGCPLAPGPCLDLQSLGATRFAGSDNFWSQHQRIVNGSEGTASPAFSQSLFRFNWTHPPISARVLGAKEKDQWSRLEPKCFYNMVTSHLQESGDPTVHLAHVSGGGSRSHGHYWRMTAKCLYKRSGSNVGSFQRPGFFMLPAVVHLFTIMTRRPNVYQRPTASQPLFWAFGTNPSSFRLVYSLVNSY